MGEARAPRPLRGLGDGLKVLESVCRRAAAQLRAWSPEQWDVVLYGASALFAAVTIVFSHIALYRQWGALAIGPYAGAALLSALLWRRRRRRGTGDAGADPGALEEVPGAHRGTGRRGSRWGAARAGLFVVVLAGATVAPLALEVSWRAQGYSGHVQPEVTVIERAAHRLAEAKDPYRQVVRHHKVVITLPGVPTYEVFFPYLPLMTVFGLPGSSGVSVSLTDARIMFTLATLVVVAGALAMCRGPVEPKVRTLQVLTVLPTAALPLATGGDDLPIVAFLLLAMVLAQRRRPGWSGLVLGVVSAMKFTAWPLAALALFAARDVNGRRAPGRMLAGMLAVMVPVVLPFFIVNPIAFIDNVVLFPLGLSGVASPAASALPGHLLESAVPLLGHVVPLVILLVGGAYVVRLLVRRPPSTTAEVTLLAGWILTVAILFAPATRVGYLLYPINFFVWSWLLRRDEGTVVMGESARVRAEAKDQKLSASWRSSRSKRVDSPAVVALPPLAAGNVVAATLRPACQYQPSEPPLTARIWMPWWLVGLTLWIRHPIRRSSLR